jgi:hypothetical protein
MAEREGTYAERLELWDDENLRSILKLKYGREFLWRFLSKCGVFHQSLVPDNMYLTAFNEGRRSIGNALLTQVIRLNPEAYLLMMKAAKQEEKYAKQAADKEIIEKENKDNG